MLSAQMRADGLSPLFLLCGFVAALAYLDINAIYEYWPLANASIRHRVPTNAQQTLARCASLSALPNPPEYFLEREISDRFEPGTNSTLIRNATIWTGRDNGTEVIHGDLLLENGLVKAMGIIAANHILGTHNLTEVNAQHGWITPGLVDLHSHVGVLSAPGMHGTFDLDSPKGPVLPWLRSIDAFNTHDDAFQLAIAGGVTSVQVLPGNANAIGGQAFMMKLRKTSEGSPSSMLIDAPFDLDGNEDASHLRWRHMHLACGQTLRRYGTRMDAIWALRSAYSEARKLKLAQDLYCEKVAAGRWGELEGEFPENMQWEALVDVLRGRVKISAHCSEAVDFDDIVRLTHEFQFPIASFHHASEAWLVPDVLKQTWGGTPSVAMFATRHRTRRESYRGSEHAPRVLADHQIPVVMTSHHPTINSRYVLHEAQQAHYFGLPVHLALASVTSVPAIAAGLSHRLGTLHEGADADLVLWDSHPLQLGATPLKVWIDGILEIPVPRKAGDTSGDVVVGKGKDAPVWREVPRVPDWDAEREEAVKWEGLPPLTVKEERGRIVFHNVREVWARDGEGGIAEVVATGLETGDKLATVVVEQGKIICAGPGATCATAASTAEREAVNLRGGSISPAFMSFGSPLGLEEIAEEPSTGDGGLYNAFTSNPPRILGDAGGMARAVDALQFGTRNALLAHRSGVTTATSSLHRSNLFKGSQGVICGLSTTFRTGATHALEKGAIVQEISALQVVVSRAYPYSEGASTSVSQTIAGLRRMLQGWEAIETETGFWFKQAVLGIIPLVIEVSSADIMATLLVLKDEIEERFGSTMRMVFSGATEAHMLASSIKDAGVGVILNPLRSYPMTWSDRRILAGPPLSNETALVELLEHGVTVGMGIREAWSARNTRFDLTWAAIESNGRLTRRDVYELASTNLENLMGLKGVDDDMADLVAYDGGSAFDLSSKVVAVLCPMRGVVDLMQ